MKDRIVENIKDAAALESLYREDPKAFESGFPEAYSENPKSQILKVWNERLNFKSVAREKNTMPTNTPSLPIVILLALVGTVFVKLPVLFQMADPDRYYEKNAAFCVLVPVVLYFLIKKKASFRQAIVPVGLLVLSALYINLAPFRDTDTSILAMVHLPFFLWSVVGLAYVLPRWKDLSARIDYLRFNGEMLIYTGILAISGGVLTGITMGLFSATGMDISEWYGEWIIISGIVAAPLIATYLTEIREVYNQRIAPLIAKIFAPLLLVTLVAYLVAVVAAGKNPFLDREFLIGFNAMLLGVLAISIFILTEQSGKNTTGTNRAMNAITMALLVIALFVDIEALSAMVFRLASYGLTPNRVAVLGVNVLVFVNIVGIIYCYGRYLMNKDPLSKTTDWIARYLPAYAIWTAFIVFLYPEINHLINR